MAKYLLEVVYNTEGVRGVVKEGGVARREEVSKLFASIGGKIEAFYYAFGTTDLYIIVDLPDNVKAVAASLPPSAAGTAKATMTVLVTPEEMDEAAKVAQEMMPAYRAPGR